MKSDSASSTRIDRSAVTEDELQNDSKASKCNLEQELAAHSKVYSASTLIILVKFSLISIKDRRRLPKIFSSI